MPTEQPYISLTTLARRLGLPASWLKSEARAGRLPYLRVGRRFMFNLDSVEAELHRRSERGADTHPKAVTA